MTNQATASVLFGGNVEIDKQYAGEWGKTVYEQSSNKDIEKHAIDPRGVYSTTLDSTDTIRKKVNTTFRPMLEKKNNISTQTTINESTADRLSNLGYLS